VKQRKLTPRAARVNAGLMAKDVVAALGISNATLWNWENGNTSPSIAVAQRLADMYHIPLDEIAFYTQD